jgi:hypothetical protein
MPLAEIGTAQQEVPVAKLETLHTLQLTTEEIDVLYHALDDYIKKDDKEWENGFGEEFLAKFIYDLRDVLNEPGRDSRANSELLQRWNRAEHALYKQKLEKRVASNTP